MTRFDLALVALALIISGCQAKRPPTISPPAKIDYTAPLPEGEVALRQIAPAQYPDFSAGILPGDLDALKRSIDNSLKYFARPSSAKVYPYLNITHERAVATLLAFRELLDQLPAGATSRQLDALIAQRFDVYASVGAPAPNGSGYTGQVLFTGYYTPTYDASLTRGGPYQFPLYKRPADLITDESGERAGRRGDGGAIVAYYTRQEIEAGHQLDGQELAWLTTRWNAYVVTVQGSGRLRLSDGRIMEVGYAGTNGYPYTSPGRRMVSDGVIPQDQLSFETMRAYFQSNPLAMDKYLWMNRRTTFFAQTHGGPFGAINVPVTAFASIATDKSVYPAGMLAFINAPTSYAGKNLAGQFMMDQDRGGAIRSAGRCDIYMGIGDGAEQMSGRQLSPGRLYYLAIKPELVSHYRQPGARVPG